MEANREQAERCCDIATTALAAGNVDKARRFVEKSLRLYPSPRAEALAARLKNAPTADDTPQPSPQPSAANQKQANGGEGLRQRARPTASRQASDDSTSSQRPYTPEQHAAVRRVLSAKSLYEVLKIEKTADKTTIKRSYRKLALEVHPDRNPAPQSDEAIREINKAFEVLYDDDKRRRYDVSGSLEDTPQAGHPFHQRGGGFHGGAMSPDEFAEFIFTGRMPRGFRMHTERRHHHHGPRQANQDQQQNEFGLPNFLVVLLFLLFTFSASLFSTPREPPPEWALRKGGSYFLERTVTDFPFIKYYVQHGFSTYDRSPDGRRHVAQIERDVVTYYVQTLRRNCQAELQQKDRDEKAARRRSPQVLEAVRNRKLRHCEQLEEYEQFRRDMDNVAE